MSVNQRKGKVKQLFDLELQVEAVASGGSIIRVAEFTADAAEAGDLELKGASGLAVEQKEKLLQVVFGVLEQFKADLHTTHGLPLLIEANSFNPDNVSISASGINGTSGSGPSAKSEITSNTSNTTPSSTSQSQSQSSSVATLNDSVEFNCPAAELYKFLTEQPRILAWSRSSPSGLPQLILPGAPFSLFNGNIHGRFVELKPPSLLKLEWQLRDWSQPSQVSISLSDTPSGCRVDLEQVGVPRGELESIRSNWHTYYWRPIKSLLGML